MRIAIFLDTAARSDEAGIHVHQDSVAFARFAVAVASQLGDVRLWTREAMPAQELAALNAPASADVEHVGLAMAVGAADVRGLLAGLPHLHTRLIEAVKAVDVVWLFGPSPLATIVLTYAKASRTRVVLGVRQDTMAYFSRRAHGIVRPVILAAGWLTEAAFRVAAVRTPVTCVGSPALSRYAHSPHAVSMRVTPTTPVAALRAPTVRDVPRGRPVRLLTVGRVAREKNPELAIDVARMLKVSGVRFTWQWVGDGPLRADMQRREAASGVDDVLNFAGFRAPGPDLDAAYDAADLFVHIATSEGVPGVFFEAGQSGLPIVATEVGGVPDVIEPGINGLLVAPCDAHALHRVICQVLSDESSLRPLSTGAAKTLGSVTLADQCALAAPHLQGKAP